MDKTERELKWLRFLDDESLKVNGKHGMFGNSVSEKEAVETYRHFRKLLQRIEWWPDYDPMEVMKYIGEKGISVTELLWVIRAVSLDYDYVLGRIKGERTPKDFFQKTEKEIGDIETKITKSLESGSLGNGEVCFITCCNDTDELEEMNAYISRLFVPPGITVSSIEVRDALSMCSGYNEAMEAVSSKIKVYIHQDVRILNRFFLYDILEIFSRDSNIGMIGLVGTKAIPSTGVMWDIERFGAVIETSYDDEKIEKTLHEINSFGGDMVAEMADGFLLATSADIRWREDIFDGWDFYDSSQCAEFLRRGFKIIVPEQSLAWCLHDFGSNNMSNYEKYRKRFVETYG